MRREISTTFGSWKDRLTYIVAEAQFLVAGVLVSVAVGIIWFRPSLPGIPDFVIGWFVAILMLGPPLTGFFIWFVRKLRRRHMVEVQHINARKDIAKTKFVAPGIWDQKRIEGANPYPVNAGDSYAVQEFEWDEEMHQLRVKGVYLSELEDTKLYTSKSHMEAMYSKLTESHIALAIFRDSVEQFGADVQHRLTNLMAEAREKGKLMDPDAVSETFSEFEDDVADLGADDLPTIEAEEELGEIEAGDVAGEAAEEIFETQAEAAADGGADQ